MGICWKLWEELLIEARQCQTFGIKTAQIWQQEPIRHHSTHHWAIMFFFGRKPWSSMCALPKSLNTGFFVENTVFVHTGQFIAKKLCVSTFLDAVHVDWTRVFHDAIRRGLNTVSSPFGCWWALKVIATVDDRNINDVHWKNVLSLDQRRQGEVWRMIGFSNLWFLSPTRCRFAIFGVFGVHGCPLGSQMQCRGSCEFSRVPHTVKCSNTLIS